MIKNWLLLSYRRFLRNTTNSLINIFGLSLGIIVFLLIFVYVKHEFSYDNFHRDGDRVFRLIKENPPGDNNYEGRTRQAVLPAPLAGIIKAQIPGVRSVTRMASWGGVTVEAEGKSYYEDSYHAADADLFDILTFTPIAGSTQQALQNPNTVAISEAMAIKYFGTVNAIGKVLDFTGFKPLGSYTVDLVFKSFPSNSSFHFNIILRFVDFVNALQPTDLDAWNNSNYHYLVKTSENTNPHEVERQLRQFFVKKYEGTIHHDEGNASYWLEPLGDIYLKSDVNFSNTPRNDINRLYMLTTIAIFILLVAGINYVNLTTARSVRRAKEVGIRKVSGAYPSTLILQFLADALSVSVISTAAAVAVVWSIFPAYADFVGKPLPLDFLSDRWLLAAVLIIPVAFGLMAGIYPAFVLSSFKPVKILRGNYGRSNDGNLLRDTLTVFQFAISGGLIMAVLIIGRQLDFIDKHNPGYDRDHILRVSLTDQGVREKRNVFVEELRKHPNILATSLTSYFPNAVNTQQSREWKGPNGSTNVSFYTIHADDDYVDLFNIKIVKGRNFSRDIPSDKNAFLINETAAKTYGWNDPVGMQFTGEQPGLPGDTVRIIGVIKDINFASYKRPIVPFRIGFAKDWSWQLAIKVKPDDLPETLSYIEENYKKLATTKFPYSLSFFNEDFGNVYKADRQLGKLITLFSFVSVLVACIGLYGLSIHTVAQRLKEIGIRKILGAELGQITYMLSRKFVALVLIAFVVASPLAYFVMEQWLQTFAYHISFGPGTFVIAVVTMVLIALATVGSQTWRAAVTNPAEVLRRE